MRISIPLFTLTFFTFVYATSELEKNEKGFKVFMENQIFLGKISLVDLIKFSSLGKEVIPIIQEYIPGWDLTKGNGKDISSNCKLTAEQFYFRPQTKEHSLTVYSNIIFKSDSEWECVIKIFSYLNYLDLVADIDLSTLQKTWNNILIKASRDKANALIKSLINKFVPYQNPNLSDGRTEYRHRAARIAAKVGNIKLLNWFIENNEPIDIDSISASIYNQELIKLLLPKFVTAEQYEKAIQTAIGLKNTDILRLIVEKAKSLNINIKVESLINYACRHGYIDAVKMLKTDDILSDKNSIQNFLWEAARGDHLAMVKYLVETLDANHRLDLELVVSFLLFAIEND